MATKEQQQETKVSRHQAANQVVAAVKGKTTLSALAQQADELFVAGGGVSRLNAATHQVRTALETGEALGLLKLTKPTDMLVELSKK